MPVPGAANVVSDVRTVVAGRLPQPESVTVAGSLNSEMGCPGDWQPACQAAFMASTRRTRSGGSRFPTCPPGSYEFKAAINGSWDENYGAGGGANGSNIVLNHPGGAVTFRYEHTQLSRSR